jgi:hypothetical protein
MSDTLAFRSYACEMKQWVIAGSLAVTVGHHTRPTRSLSTSRPFLSDGFFHRKYEATAKP